jgi:hypothetical protein
MYEYFYIMAIQVWTMCRFNMVIVYVYISASAFFFLKTRNIWENIIFWKQVSPNDKKMPHKKRVDATS